MRQARRGGRPRKDEALEMALLDDGGLKTVVEGLVGKGVTNQSIVDYLARKGGIRITVRTLRNWRRRWTARTPNEEVAA